MHEKFVNAFSRVIYNTKWTSERGYELWVSFPFLKTHRPLMTGRQARLAKSTFGCSEEKTDYQCLSFDIRMQIFCDCHTKTATAAVTPADHVGSHPPGTANYGWKEKVL